jgi:hypothetical protein
MATDIFQKRAEAKAAVDEIQTKKRAHLRTIEEKENALLGSVNREQAQAAQAAAFFRDEPGALVSIVDLENDLRRLHSQLPLYDAEIKNREQALAALASEYQAAIWVPLKPKDDANKREMAEALIKLAKCCAAEVDLIDEMLQADTRPPAAFRIMRPTFVGTLNDPNAFVNLWLRELAQYYPHIKVKVD